MTFFRKVFGGGSSSDLPSDQTEAILSKYFDSDLKVFPMAERKTSLAQVEAIGEKYGVKYPVEFVTHVCGRFPGIYAEVKEAIWPRPKPLDVGPFWSFLYAFHTFTPAAESEAWMQLSVAAESFQEKTGLTAAPVLKVVGDADVYCVNPKGQLVQFDHEVGDIKPINLSFWELFEKEAAELVAQGAQEKRHLTMLALQRPRSAAALAGIMGLTLSGPVR